MNYLISMFMNITIADLSAVNIYRVHEVVMMGLAAEIRAGGARQVPMQS